MCENTISGDETKGVEKLLFVGRYRVVRHLGQGGMGSVWLAEDTQLDNRPVAIKMLPSILVSNKRAYQQLKAEALLSLKLTHPNIATVRAFEENNGNPFLVVDYVDGITLDDYLAERTRGPMSSTVSAASSPSKSARAPSFVSATPSSPICCGLPESEVIRILAPIAAALDYAHSKGVIHRDVKPGNVMIAKDGTPYILDFGIAREICETLTRVTGRFSSGTLMYMSPEQLNGDAPSVAQDVYSFAAMAYECLTGAPPFPRGGVEFQIMNKKPQPLKTLIAISVSVMAGLAKLPEDRPVSCAAVLAGACREIPAHGRNTATEGERHAVAEGRGPSRRLMALAACVLASFVALCVWWALKSEDDAAKAQEAVMAQRHAHQQRLEQIRRQAEQDRLAAEVRRQREKDRDAEERRKTDEARALAAQEAALRLKQQEAERTAARKAADAEQKRQREERLRQERAAQQREKKEAERRAQAMGELRELKAAVSQIRDCVKNVQAESVRPAVQPVTQPAVQPAVSSPQKRSVSLSDRSSNRFTSDDAQTLSSLKFPSALARAHYVRACELAKKGAHNKVQVKAEYDKGRTYGGPEWPELAAWLDWWE